MEHRLRILVVDDETEFRELLTIILSRRGHQVIEASSGEVAISILNSEPLDLVLTDLRMAGMSGMAVLSEIQSLPQGLDLKPECIVITGYGSIENAIEAIKNGAFSYFVKSNDPEELLSTIDKIAKIRSLSKKNKVLKNEFSSSDHMLNSRNGSFVQLLKAAEKIAQTDTNVLLLGESGVGKEVIARYIHRCSKRRDEIFMPVNCYAFSESMIEAELYGHEKGAFTGSAGMRAGRFEAADQGTLFLDEIGELSLSTQIKLLRNIENKEIQRIGSNKTIYTDFRLISATNKNLEHAVLEKSFREDLYYRINTIVLEIPPLRERKEDLPLLIEYFLEKACKEMKKPIRGIAPGLMKILESYEYPGNIRELKNIIERLLVFSEGEWITADDLAQNRAIGNFGSLTEEVGHLAQMEAFRSLKSFRTMAEKAYIENVLSHVEQDLEQAAKILEISTRQLYNKLNQFSRL